MPQALLIGGPVGGRIVLIDHESPRSIDVPHRGQPAIECGTPTPAVEMMPVVRYHRRDFRLHNPQRTYAIYVADYDATHDSKIAEQLISRGVEPL